MTRCATLAHYEALGRGLPAHIPRVKLVTPVGVARHKITKIIRAPIQAQTTKCSPRTEANPVKTSRATTFGQEEAQTSPTPSNWGGWGHWVAGRPPWSADQPMGPTALLLRRGSSSLLLDVDSWRNSCRNTREGGRKWNTHTTPLNLSCLVIGLVEFRSLGVIESQESLESFGMGSSLVLSCNIR